MLSAARAHDAQPLLEVGYLQEMEWVNEKRKQSCLPLAIGATTEAGQIISDKLHDALETKSQPANMIPFMQPPPHLSTLNVHVPFSVAGPHTFKTAPIEIAKTLLVQERKWKKSPNDEACFTTAVDSSTELKSPQDSLECGRMEQAKQTMQQNIHADQTEKGKKHCPVCSVQWTWEFPNCCPPHMRVKSENQGQASHVFCPFADGHSIYQCIIAGRKLKRSMINQRQYIKNKDK